MGVLTSSIVVGSDSYKANERAHLEALGEVQEVAEAALRGGSDASRAAR